MRLIRSISLGRTSKKTSSRHPEQFAVLPVEILRPIFLAVADQVANAARTDAAEQILAMALVSKLVSEWLLPFLPKVSIHTEVKQWKQGVLPELRTFLNLYVQPQHLHRWCQWHTRTADKEDMNRDPTSIFTRSAIHTIILSGGPPACFDTWYDIPKESNPFRIVAPTLRRLAIDLGTDGAPTHGSILWYSTRYIRPTEIYWRCRLPTRVTDVRLFRAEDGEPPRLPKTTHMCLNLGAAVIIASGSPAYHLPKLRYVILEDGDQEPALMQYVIKKLTSLKTLRRIILGHGNSNPAYISASKNPAKVMFMELDKERTREQMKYDVFDWTKKMWKHVETTDDLQRITGSDPRLKKALALAW
ncbi:hypothetical protein DL96DRAFT_1678302 [Flagelloscypha sp. PMI_526]|nr:hypothetical protein DL96DRAFT_1678302 [Flagelloscypha sp. PMI_526]